MAIVNRSTLKRWFETGDRLANTAFVALLDSGLNSQDTTAQTLGSDLIANQIVASGASAGEAAVTQLLTGSAAQFSGIVKHGVSAAASASSSFGYPVLIQEATVAATATTQVALLPDSSNIISLGARVLAASSGAGGGTTINIGNGAAIDFFGSRTVSAVGHYRFTAVCARRLQNTSGAVFAAGITASGGANFVPFVHYYRVVAAPVSGAAAGGGLSLVEVSALGSAIGNDVGVSAAFDGVTDAAADNGTSTYKTATVRGFVGQAWDGAKKIGQFAVWDPNNEGWRGNTNIESIRLYGNNSNDITGASILASVAATYVIPTVVVTVAQTEINTTNSFTYHWVAVSGGGGTSTTYITEVKFWELL